ncbi:MAG: UTRA domain-containing protein [Pseudomonadota bacterium]
MADRKVRSKALTLDGKGPLYAQIKRAIAGQITAGQWKPGAPIPFEEDLSARFNTSRMTVNRALTSLAEEGLIVRIRRKGSFVAAQSSHHASFTISDIRDEIEASGAAYRYELIHRAIQWRPLASFGEKALHLVCRHSADNAPVLLEERWIDLATVPQAADQDFCKIQPNSWLLEHVPWTKAEHQISAVNASPRTAGLLDLAPGTACLVLERKTWREAQPVTFVHLIYAGPAHRLVGTFAPTG